MHEQKRMEEVEMNCLRNICGLGRIDRGLNVKLDVEKNASMRQRIDQGLLTWFRHVERIKDERMDNGVYESNVRGVRRR